MRVIIIGAGRVGCGALGMAFAMQGHEVVLAARRAEEVDSINRLGYDVVTKGAIEARLEVRGVHAVLIAGPEFNTAFAEADIVYTSVRPDNLPGIATPIADALIHRITAGVERPLDIFCCENLKNAGSQLERLIFTGIPSSHARQVQDWIGFNSAISDRIVSGLDRDENGRIVITADATGDVLVDISQMKGEFELLPPFKGIDNFPACIEEKLYVLNCGHAVCAYLGFHKGYKYIHEAMEDETINRAVVGAMLESQQALQNKHGKTLHYAGFINEILASFSNAALGDTVARVGRDPIRKLQADDRLVGPAKLAYRYGVEPKNLIRGCAAALTYMPEDDPQAEELQAMVEEKGYEKTLAAVSQLQPWNPLSKLVREEIARQAVV